MNILVLSVEGLLIFVSYFGNESGVKDGNITYVLC